MQRNSTEVRVAVRIDLQQGFSVMHWGRVVCRGVVLYIVLCLRVSLASTH